MLRFRGAVGAEAEASGSVTSNVENRCPVRLVDVDRSAVRLDDRADEAQAEAEAALGPAGVASETADPKSARQFVGRNPAPRYRAADNTAWSPSRRTIHIDSIRRTACISARCR